MTTDAIKAACAHAYHTTVKAIDGRGRPKDVAEARQVAMWVTRTVLGYSFPVIGLEFGGRDHSTVIHAVQRIARKVAESALLRARISEIGAMLGFPTGLVRIACTAFAAGSWAGLPFDWTESHRTPTDKCSVCTRERSGHVEHEIGEAVAA